MINLFSKYWKLILDILLVVALVVGLFLWNPFDLFGKETRLHPTANVATQIKQIGQLVTAEYYGEVVASFGEAKLNFLKEDLLNEEANTIYIDLKADVYDAYLDFVVEGTKKFSKDKKRERKKKQARKDAVDDLIKNYGKEPSGVRYSDLFIKDTLDIVLLFVAEKVLDERTGMDLKKLDSDRKRKKFREQQMENLLAAIEEKHLSLDDKGMDLFLQEPLMKNPSFSSFYYTLYQEDEKSKDQLAMIGRGSVKAGFDFGSFRESNLYMDEDDGVIHIFGLEPVILDFDINPWFIPERAVPGYDIVQAGRKVSFEDAKKVKSYCRAKLRRRALEAGIIAEAKRYGEEVVKTFLALVLETDVKKVIFHENLEKVFFEQITRDGVIHQTEIALIESAEQQFLQKIEEASSATLKKAYRNQLSHLLFSLRKYPLQMVDGSKIPFNYFTKELYPLLNDSAHTDTSIKPISYLKIEKDYRWGIDTTNFVSEQFSKNTYWFHDSAGIVQHLFIDDYNTMLKYIHLDSDDTLIKPNDLKYVCIFSQTEQDSLIKLDSLNVPLEIDKNCQAKLSAQQKIDLENYSTYLRRKHKDYSNKSWIYKMRGELSSLAQAEKLRASLTQKLK